MNNRLEIIRKQRSLEWGELAVLLGISRSMLNQIRSGNRHPSPKLLRKIQEAEKTLPHPEHNQKIKEVPHLGGALPNCRTSKEKPRPLSYGERTIRITANATIERMDDAELMSTIQTYASRLGAHSGFDQVITGMALIELVDEVIARAQFPRLPDLPPAVPPDPGAIQNKPEDPKTE